MRLWLAENHEAEPAEPSERPGKGSADDGHAEEPEVLEAERPDFALDQGLAADAG
jgi:hypothetical protein